MVPKLREDVWKYVLTFLVQQKKNCFNREAVQKKMSFLSVLGKVGDPCPSRQMFFFFWGGGVHVMFENVTIFIWDLWLWPHFWLWSFWKLKYSIHLPTDIADPKIKKSASYRSEDKLEKEILAVIKCFLEKDFFRRSDLSSLDSTIDISPDFSVG